MNLKVGIKVTWVDDYMGRLVGTIIDLWPEQQIAVVEVEDDAMIGDYFVPYAKLEAV